MALCDLYFGSLGDMRLGLRASNSGQRLKGGPYGRSEWKPPTPEKGSHNPLPPLALILKPGNARLSTRMFLSELVARAIRAGRFRSAREES